MLRVYAVKCALLYVNYKNFVSATYQKHRKSASIANKLKDINRIKREQRLNKTKTH